MSAVAAVTILLLALSETVHAFGGGVPFALDADGCVVDYQPGCAALYLQPYSPEASLARFTAHVSSYKQRNWTPRTHGARVWSESNGNDSFPLLSLHARVSRAPSCALVFSGSC